MPLLPSDSAQTWIRHFVNSDNPKFKGKSKKERVQMALGAWYAAQEDVSEEMMEDLGKEIIFNEEFLENMMEAALDTVWLAISSHSAVHKSFQPFGYFLKEQASSFDGEVSWYIKEEEDFALPYDYSISILKKLYGENLIKESEENVTLFDLIAERVADGVKNFFFPVISESEAVAVKTLLNTKLKLPKEWDQRKRYENVSFSVINISEGMEPQKTSISRKKFPELASKYWKMKESFSDSLGQLKPVSESLVTMQHSYLKEIKSLEKELYSNLPDALSPLEQEQIIKHFKGKKIR